MTQIAVSNPEGRSPPRDSILAALERIEGRLARLEAAAQRAELAAQQAPGAVAALVDTFDSAVGRLQERGVDLDERLRTTLAIAERLTSPPALSAVSTILDHLDDLRFLLDSGVLDKHAVRLVGELGRALAASASEAPPRVGMLGAMRALGTPDVQRAVGLALRLAGRFGASLRDIGASSPALTQGDR